MNYEAILNEIEQQLKSARTTSEIADIRAHLTAIQALCNAALGGSSRKASLAILTTQPSTPTFVTSEANSLPVTAAAQSVRLEEEDANGESLFDF